MVLLRILLLTALACGSADAQMMQAIVNGKSGPSAPTWTIVGSTSCQFTSGSSGCTTALIDVTGANLIVVQATASATAVASLVFGDNHANTYTNCVSTGPSGATQTIVDCYKISPTVSNSQNFSLVGTNAFASLTVLAVKDNSGTPTYSTSFTQFCNTASTTVQPGSLTTSGSHDLVISGVGYNASSAATLTVNSGMTIDRQFVQVTNAIGAGIAHLEQTVAGAINPTWTGSVTPTEACTNLTYFSP